MPADCFFDSNIILYFFSADKNKADIAKELIMRGGVMSVQVLNETISVALGKLKQDWATIDQLFATLKLTCQVQDITAETQSSACRIAKRYQLQIYDAQIIASALEAGCKTLFSEDMQHGQLFEGQLQLINPFVAA
jgi:predicted nucleic acid-binding protein